MVSDMQTDRHINGLRHADIQTYKWLQTCRQTDILMYFIKWVKTSWTYTAYFGIDIKIYYYLINTPSLGSKPIDFIALKIRTI